MAQCPKCGSQAPDGAQNCPICFASMSAAAAPPPAPQPAAPSASDPLGLGAPLEDHETLRAGIPGIDNVPREASPAPTAPPLGLAGGGTRTTLAGDVIPDAPPPNPYGQPIAGMPSGPTTMRPIPPSAGPAGRGSTRIRSASAESTRSGGFPVGIVVVILLLLSAGGVFGFWYWQKQQAPARAADQFMSAFQKKDWKPSIA